MGEDICYLKSPRYGYHRTPFPDLRQHMVGERKVTRATVTEKPSHSYRIIKDKFQSRPSSMSSLMFTPSIRPWDRINSCIRSTAADLSLERAPSDGTRSATALPRLVMVKLFPFCTCRSNSGSFVFASYEPISV